MGLLVCSFWLASFLVWSAANPIFKDPAHCPLSSPVCNNISEAHAAIQHLKRVQELQLWQSVESVLTFSHFIYVNETHQEFSPSCYLAEGGEFSLQLYLMIYTKQMLLYSVWSRFKTFNFDGVLSLSWHFSILFRYKKLVNKFSLIPPNRRSGIFTPAWNMSSLSDDVNEKILNRFRNSKFFKHFCNTVHDPTERNLGMVSQLQKVCVARIGCVSSSPSNCLDFLISTAVLPESKYKCTRWWSELLTKEEQLTGWGLLQEVSLDRSLQQVWHSIQYLRLHLHLNALR